MPRREHQQPRAVTSARLVGRERELALLQGSLTRAIHGQGGLVLVSGEAGIGKTSLVEAIVRDARELGALVLSGAAYDLTATPPYGPWLEITDGYPTDDGLPALPDVLKQWAGMGILTDQADLFAVARDFLTEVATRRPLVLVIEDLHWADPASLDTLRFLARRLSDHRLLIVATYREEEIDREHPLFSLLPVLVRESGADRIGLRPLSEMDVHPLITSRYQLGADDAARLTTYLMQRAEGNPLYVNEILRALEEDGRLRIEGESWSLGELTGLPVPNMLLQVIERRLERLDTAHRTNLEDAAVIGHEVPLQPWRVISELTEDEQSSIVHDAIEASLMSASRRPGRVSFSHALFREALYQGTSPPRRQSLHRRIADSMMESEDPEPDSVAYHLARAGDPRAPGWLVLAGERAQSSYAFKTAAEHFAAASDVLRGHEDRLRERGWLLYRAALLLRYSELPRAIRLLDEAELLGMQVDDSALVAYARTDRGQVRSDSGNVARGFEEMRSGILAIDALTGEYLTSRAIAYWVADVASVSSIGGHEPSASRPFNSLPTVNARRGSFALWSASTGRFADAIETARQSIAEIEERTEPDNNILSGYADALSALGVSYAALAQPGRARDAFSTAYDVLTRIGHHNQVAMTAMRYLSLVHLRFSADDLDERHRSVQILEAFVNRAEDAMTSLAADAFVNFDLLWIEAKWGSIRKHGAVALTFPSSYFRQSASVAFGRLERESGNHDRAWSHVNRVLPDGLDSKPGESEKFQFALDAHALAANLARDKGDLEPARRWIERHGDWLTWSGAVAWNPVGELLWAKYYRLTGDGARARRRAARCLELSSDPEQPLALIAAHRIVGELHAERGDFSEASSHLQESLLRAEACSAPFERALTLLALAELQESNGQPDAVRELSDEAASILEPLDARPALERAAALRQRLGGTPADGNSSGLTAREVEVLRLVADGKSDREIGEALFISHRTVMRHVSNILAKLDVDSRAAAAAYAVRHDVI